MPTFKVVVIGASGVGKTSLRGQYISARFSSSYRATIGADFITKTLPPLNPDEDEEEPVTLQIWDTAGQERFSSLASAFFRGADAAILMYDVTAPETLEALTKWWGEFRDKAPVEDEDLPGFCVAVVGNKVDLLVGVEHEGVSPAQGARFVRTLIPRPDTPPLDPPLSLHAHTPEDEYDDDLLASSQLTARPLDSPTPTSILRPNGRHHHPSASQISFSPLAIPGASRASSRARSTVGRASLSTATSTLTIYHTPSSSVFSDSASEYWHDAQSLHSPSYSTVNRSFADSLSSDGSPVRTNGNGSIETRPNRSPSETWLTEPETAEHTRGGAAHFRTSARSGEGVGDVFAWVARRLVGERKRREAEMGLNGRGNRRRGGASGGGSVEDRLRVRLGLGLNGATAGEGGKCC
ncbi:ras-domain-containing protein [Roridomyces roridus]|uniref:Ras-domain-containing protein n=1 Tax=Roridomyces roridus TaxID=1738132 RepID=A0AAD7BDD5_9AGAR|nr:ras-domain-containing protein [Roridomyces roridus]